MPTQFDQRYEKGGQFTREDAYNDDKETEKTCTNVVFACDSLSVAIPLPADIYWHFVAIYIFHVIKFANRNVIFELLLAEADNVAQLLDD